MTKCLIDGCERKSSVRGLCNTHRMRVARYEERMNKPGVSFRSERPEMEAHRKVNSNRPPLPGGDE